MVLHLLINHGTNYTKFVKVQQAQTIFNYKNTKTNEAIWFNRIRKIYYVTRMYKHAKVTHFTVHLLL